MPDNQNTSSVADPTSVQTVLVVESQEDLGEFIVQALLQETPYQAVLATDGFEALKMVRSLVPNVFLVDYALPSMDGIELYDHLQESEEVKDIPVIMFTEDISPELEEREVISIKKPAELDELLQTVMKVLG